MPMAPSSVAVAVSAVVLLQAACVTQAFMPQLSAGVIGSGSVKNTRGRSSSSRAVAGGRGWAAQNVFASKRSPLTTRLHAAEPEKTEVEVAEEDDPTYFETEKIFYDARSGRFYEKNMEEVCRDEYCTIDKETGKQIMLSKEEKERIFLDSIQSFYYSSRKVLEDDDFDRLKSDLEWEGSEVVFMNRKEKLFLAAMGAYSKGESIITDSEFDTLKAELKEEGSKVAVSTEPKCYVDTGICSVTFQEDKFRNLMLYVAPGGTVFFFFFFGLLYEIIEPLRYINPLLLIPIAMVPTWAASKVFTEKIFLGGNPLVVYGPCPSCGAENRVFFGDIVGVEGYKRDAEIKCTNCKTKITVGKADLRARSMPSEELLAT